ncbi:copper ABC transporter substrate-binding protein [bacterium DOLZORAL124_64_63]|nr:MAG: copper ABC transporter substrate-binding protein [bacterium DOLZORAL124_64_63]
MRGLILALALWLMVPLPSPVTAAERPSLQELVDRTPVNGTLVPEPGVYAGPIIVESPITIDGRGLVTIDAGGEGSVVVLQTDGATLKNLHLRNSGALHNDIDSGVQVRGNFNVVRNCYIDDCLFGVDLQQSNNNIVRANTIYSKDMDLGQRGDAVRLWYSFNNKIHDNECHDMRDMVVWYSRDNDIRGNILTGSRYSLHFMYSQYNVVEDNWYYNNAVGIFLMYSDGIVVRNNHVLHAAGPTGVGIGFKETSDLTIENNEVLYCASGLYIDVSPFQPDTFNSFKNNIIAYCGFGVRFLNDWHDNIFQSNDFSDNLTQVVVGGGGVATGHQWDGNYWSDYKGFDQDGDGVGDTPHEIYVYSDRIWLDNSYAQFFKGSPLLETLDFLERLVPFSEPKLMLRDEHPRMRKEAAGVIHDCDSHGNN